MTFDFNDFISNQGGSPKAAPRPNLTEMKTAAKSVFESEEFTNGDGEVRSEIVKTFVGDCMRKGLPKKDIETVMRAHFRVDTDRERNDAKITKVVTEARNFVKAAFVAEAAGFDPRERVSKKSQENQIIAHTLRPSSHRKEMRFPTVDENGEHYNRVVDVQTFAKNDHTPLIHFFPCGASFRAVLKERAEFQATNIDALRANTPEILAEFFEINARCADAAETAEGELKRLQGSVAELYLAEFPNSGKGRKATSQDITSILDDIDLDF